MSVSAYALRVVGAGRVSAGDDGVGLAVIARLRAMRDAGEPGTEFLDLESVAEPSALIEHLWSPMPVIIVDALRCSDPVGTLHWLRLEALAARTDQTTSHGMSVHEACHLARTLDAARFTPDLALLGVAIEMARRGSLSLSPDVQAAVDAAASAIVARGRTVAEGVARHA